MNIEEINKILEETPDKAEWSSTTSLKFKKDLVEFFGEDFKDTEILEVGCHAGHTTRILSYLFKKVYAMNINEPSGPWKPNYIIWEDAWYKHYSVNLETSFNKEFENINFLEMDSYNQEGWPTDVLKDVSVVFIDAVHEYYPVLSDINNAVKLNAKYIVFDDYGLIPEVRAAVDSKINDGTLEVIKKIGFEPMTQVGFNIVTGPRLTADFEGLICKVR